MGRKWEWNWQIRRWQLTANYVKVRLRLKLEAKPELITESQLSTNEIWALAFSFNVMIKIVYYCTCVPASLVVLTVWKISSHVHLVATDTDLYPEILVSLLLSSLSSLMLSLILSTLSSVTAIPDEDLEGRDKDSWKHSATLASDSWGIPDDFFNCIFFGKLLEFLVFLMKYEGVFVGLNITIQIWNGIFCKTNLFIDNKHPIL